MHRLCFLLACLFFLGLASPGLSQTPLRDKIRTGAQAQADSLQKAEYAKVVDSMYPPAVEMAGRDKLIRNLQGGAAKMEQQGFKADLTDVGQASEPVTAGDKMFAVVPQTVHMTSPKAKLEQPGYLLAISSDKGNTWSYLDGAILNEKFIQHFFPDLPSALKLPERQQTKVTPLS